jgi:hypothetical protein
MGKWFNAILQLAPVIMPLAGVPAALVPLIMHGMIVAQHLPGADGATKKAYVLDLVSTGAATTNAAVGHTLIDPVQATGAVSQGIDATIAAVNLAHNIPAK